MIFACDSTTAILPQFKSLVAFVTASRAKRDKRHENRFRGSTAIRLSLGAGVISSGSCSLWMRVKSGVHKSYSGWRPRGNNTER